jgi:predicted amidophosphoribosyltransferase
VPRINEIKTTYGTQTELAGRLLDDLESRLRENLSGMLATDITDREQKIASCCATVSGMKKEFLAEPAPAAPTPKTTAPLPAPKRPAPKKDVKLPKPTPSAEQEKEAQWICPTCTFLNAGAMTTCESCTVPRPAGTQPAPLPPSQPTPPPSAKPKPAKKQPPTPEEHKEAVVELPPAAQQAITDVSKLNLKAAAGGITVDNLNDSISKFFSTLSTAQKQALDQGIQQASGNKRWLCIKCGNTNATALDPEQCDACYSLREGVQESDLEKQATLEKNKWKCQCKQINVVAQSNCIKCKLERPSGPLTPFFNRTGNACGPIANIQLILSAIDAQIAAELESSGDPIEKKIGQLFFEQNADMRSALATIILRMSVKIENGKRDKTLENLTNFINQHPTLNRYITTIDPNIDPDLIDWNNPPVIDLNNPLLTGIRTGGGHFEAIIKKSLNGKITWYWVDQWTEKDKQIKDYIQQIQTPTLAETALHYTGNERNDAPVDIAIIKRPATLPQAKVPPKPAEEKEVEPAAQQLPTEQKEPTAQEKAAAAEAAEQAAIKSFENPELKTPTTQAINNSLDLIQKTPAGRWIDLLDKMLQTINTDRKGVQYDMTKLLYTCQACGYGTLLFKRDEHHKQPTTCSNCHDPIRQPTPPLPTPAQPAPQPQRVPPPSAPAAAAPAEEKIYKAAFEKLRTKLDELYAATKDTADQKLDDAISCAWELREATDTLYNALKSGNSKQFVEKYFSDKIASLKPQGQEKQRLYVKFESSLSKEISTPLTELDHDIDLLITSISEDATPKKIKALEMRVNLAWLQLKNRFIPTDIKTKIDQLQAKGFLADAQPEEEKKEQAPAQKPSESEEDYLSRLSQETIGFLGQARRNPAQKKEFLEKAAESAIVWRDALTANAISNYRTKGMAVGSDIIIRYIKEKMFDLIKKGFKDLYNEFREEFDKKEGSWPTEATTAQDLRMARNLFDVIQDDDTQAFANYVEKLKVDPQLTDEEKVKAEITRLISTIKFNPDSESLEDNELTLYQIAAMDYKLNILKEFTKYYDFPTTALISAVARGDQGIASQKATIRYLLQNGADADLAITTISGDPNLPYKTGIPLIQSIQAELRGAAPARPQPFEPQAERSFTREQIVQTFIRMIQGDLVIAFDAYLKKVPLASKISQEIKVDPAPPYHEDSSSSGMPLYELAALWHKPKMTSRLVENKQQAQDALYWALIVPPSFPFTSDLCTTVKILLSKGASAEKILQDRAMPPESKQLVKQVIEANLRPSIVQNLLKLINNDPTIPLNYLRYPEVIRIIPTLKFSKFSPHYEDPRGIEFYQLAAMLHNLQIIKLVVDEKKSTPALFWALHQLAPAADERSLRPIITFLLDKNANADHVLDSLAVSEISKVLLRQILDERAAARGGAPAPIPPTDPRAGTWQRGGVPIDWSKMPPQPTPAAAPAPRPEEVKGPEAPSELLQKVCPNCYQLNSAAESFCSLCANPLSEDYSLANLQKDVHKINAQLTLDKLSHADLIQIHKIVNTAPSTHLPGDLILLFKHAEESQQPTVIQIITLISRYGMEEKKQAIKSLITAVKEKVVGDPLDIIITAIAQQQQQNRDSLMRALADATGEKLEDLQKRLTTAIESLKK